MNNIKIICSILFASFTHILKCQTQLNGTIFNLGFENSSSKDIPDPWFQWGEGKNYHISIDTVYKFSGKSSLKIQSNGTYLNNNFICITQVLPVKFKGETLRMSGFVKYKDVAEQPLGFLLRIDGESDVLFFSNKMEEKISGTSDWRQLSITTELPKKAKNIFFGVMMSGLGTVWADNFEITIDGNDIVLESDSITSDSAKIDYATVDSSVLLRKNIDDLHLLCQVWGILKYYHPRVRSGNLDWDLELHKYLPSFLKTNTKNERNKSLHTWINSFGVWVVSTQENPNNLDSSTIYPEVKWINKKDLGSILCETLHKIYISRRDSSSHYLSLRYGSDNPIFENEKIYSDFSYPPLSIRLLCLFRYWNIIQFYYPYKYKFTHNWNYTFKKYLTSFITAKNELEYNIVIHKLIAEIHDTHSYIPEKDVVTRYFGYRFAPLDVKFIGDTLVVNEVYYSSTIKYLSKGDIIMTINSMPVAQIYNEIKDKISASNNTASKFLIAPYLLRTNDSILLVVIKRNNKLITTRIPTIYWKERPIPTRLLKIDTCFKLINDSIGYLYLGNFKNQYLATIAPVMSTLKGLIIDLRCYPSDFAVYSLTELLLPKPYPFAKFLIPSLINPGQYTFTETHSVGTKKDNYYKGRIIILVDETTISQAEFTTMALQTHPNALVLGDTTLGADGDVSIIDLPGGIQTFITGIGVYYPNGTETQNIGIKPDIRVHHTFQEVTLNLDLMLIKAVNLLVYN